MSAVSTNKLTIVWLFLAASTVMSWWFGAASGDDIAHVTSVGAVAVCCLALLKCGLVLWHFMEVSTAPAWLRNLCIAWLYLFFGAVVGLYFRTG